MKEQMNINDLSLGERIQICMAFANKGDVSSLCSRYGYVRDEVTPELVESIMTTDPKGGDFAKEFVDIYLKGLNSRQAKARIATFSGLAKYNDEAFRTATGFMGVLGNIGTGILGTLGQIGVLGNLTNNQYDASLAQAQTAASIYAQENADSKSSVTKWVIIGAVVLVVIIVVLVLVKKK